MKVERSDKGEHIPEYEFRIRSRSIPDELHLVQIFADDRIECDCIAGFYKHICEHKKWTERNLIKIKRYLHGKKQKTKEKRNVG